MRCAVAERARTSLSKWHRFDWLGAFCCCFKAPAFCFWRTPDTAQHRAQESFGWQTPLYCTVQACWVYCDERAIFLTSFVFVSSSSLSTFSLFFFVLFLLTIFYLLQASSCLEIKGLFPAVSVKLARRSPSPSADTPSPLSHCISIAPAHAYAPANRTKAPGITAPNLFLLLL